MKKDLILIGGFLVLMGGVNALLVATDRIAWVGLWDWQSLSTMVAAGVTIAIMTQLYKDNPLFKLVEHLYIGSALGYGLVYQWYNIWVNQIISGLRPEAKNQLLGQWTIILPGILGLLMYTRLSKKYSWVSRMPIALMVGFGVGYSIPTTISASLLKQLQPMTMDLLHNSAGQFSIHWNELIAFVGVIATLIYFFFSLEHKRVVGAVSRVGVWFLMVAFGASFGYTVMGRLSLLIGRIDFLFREWVPLVQ